MGNGESLFKRLRDKLYGNTEVRVLMCGIDAAGKTTVLYKLKLGEVVSTIPTTGFNVETIDYKGVSFVTWDVSGRSGIRPLWRHYFQNTDVVIFVIDSNDRERISECRDELWRFLQEDELRDCLLLVLANKQDLPKAMSVEEVTEKLELNSFRDRMWHIQGTCATTGNGLYEGLSWLQATLTNKHCKQDLTNPLQETKNSIGLSSWFSSITKFFTCGSTTASAG